MTFYDDNNGDSHKYISVSSTALGRHFPTDGLIFRAYNNLASVLLHRFSDSTFVHISTSRIKVHLAACKRALHCGLMVNIFSSTHKTMVHHIICGRLDLRKCSRCYSSCSADQKTDRKRPNKLPDLRHW